MRQVSKTKSYVKNVLLRTRSLIDFQYILVLLNFIILEKSNDHSTLSCEISHKEILPTDSKFEKVTEKKLFSITFSTSKVDISNIQLSESRDIHDNIKTMVMFKSSLKI